MNYTYTKEVDVGRLDLEIRQSEITVALDYINASGSGSSMEVDIYFKAEISAGEKVILDNLVSGHVPTPIESGISQVEISNCPSIKVIATVPFAEPLFRTEMDAIAEIETVVIEGADPFIEKYCFFKLNGEKYTSGGELIVKNFQFGDWICASIYDKDGVIPEAYRPTFPAWPVIFKYIKKRYVSPDAVGYGKLILDTKPLNAKITSNLYLAVGYHAKNTGQDREIVMNYDLALPLS